MGLLNKDAIASVWCQTHALVVSQKVLKTFKGPCEWEDGDSDKLVFYFLLAAGATDADDLKKVAGLLNTDETKRFLHETAPQEYDLAVPGYMPVFQQHRVPGIMQFYRGQDCFLLALEFHETLLGGVWVA